MIHLYTSIKNVHLLILFPKMYRNLCDSPTSFCNARQAGKQGVDYFVSDDRQVNQRLFVLR